VCHLYINNCVKIHCNSKQTRSSSKFRPKRSLIKRLSEVPHRSQLHPPTLRLMHANWLDALFSKTCLCKQHSTLLFRSGFILRRGCARDSVWPVSSHCP
jgi:hypothetical protein